MIFYKENRAGVVRNPAVAGSFYPDDQKQLDDRLAGFLKQAKKNIIVLK